MSDTIQTPETALCPECGRSFEPKRNKRFCQSKCQARFNNRMAAEGKLLAPLVKAMMATRGGGGRKVPQICGMARSELTRIARELNEADAKAGRPPVHHYVAALFETGTLYMDRRRIRRPEGSRPTEAIEVPGGPFISEDDAIDRGWPAMRAYCRERGYSLSGAGANPDKDHPGTFKLNGAHVTGGNNKRLRRSHSLVARGVAA